MATMPPAMPQPQIVLTLDPSGQVQIQTNLTDPIDAAKILLQATVAYASMVLEKGKAEAPRVVVPKIHLVGGAH